MSETISIDTMQFQQLIHALNSIERRLSGIESEISGIKQRMR